MAHVQGAAMKHEMKKKIVGWMQTHTMIQWMGKPYAIEIVV